MPIRLMSLDMVHYDPIRGSGAREAVNVNELSENAETKVRALIIDDEPMACMAMKSLVERKGFTVETVTDPHEFPQAYRLSTELIILDLNMPEMDGIEMLRFLGDNRSTAAVILVSAAQENVLRAASDIATNMGLTVLGALRKPVVGAELRAYLDSFLEQRARVAEVDGEGEALEHSPFLRRGSTELPSLDELRDAIDNDEFDVYFQPKIELPQRDFAGVEALVRWNHPTKGFIPPDYFVPFAEEFGLIDALTDRVIEKACDNWRGIADTYGPFEMSINISEVSLGDLDLPEKLNRKFSDGQVPSAHIVLEITETTISDNSTHQLDTVTRLRLRGFQVSIDDFGTGHSSLARLRQIPFTELKIDKMFVNTCDTDPECRVIVSNTIELARDLGLSVVAEGVENAAQLDFLRAFECGKIQGFMFSKPLNFQDFTAWLDNWTEHHRAV